MATGWDQDGSSALRASVAELAGLLVAHESLEAVLRRVVELACGTIDGCALASVTLMDGDAPTTIVATDPIADRIDDAQYASDDGPCLDAHRERQVVSVPSMTDGDTWREFRVAAQAHGVQSSLSLPLAVGDVNLGALNLYGRRDQAFESVAFDAAALFASQAAAAIWTARTQEMMRELIGNLETALVTRDLIGMAKGIVMANEQVDAATAIELLRGASQNRNVKLHDVASEVTATLATPKP